MTRTRWSLAAAAYFAVLTTACLPPLAVEMPADDLGDSTVGATYAHTITATGATGALSYSATGLPAGLSIDVSSGAISGTPEAAGDFRVEVTATDEKGVSASRVYPLKIYEAVTIQTTSLPDATVGWAYTTTIRAQGGKPPVVLSQTGGTLPSGLTFTVATGVIDGTPDAEAVPEPLMFQAREANGAVASVSLNLTVSPAPTFEESSPGTLALASPSEHAFAAVSSPVRFELTEATLSTDLSNVRVFRNGQDLPASNVQLDGNAIVLNSALGGGRNHFVILAADSSGKALSAEATIWAGLYTLSVFVNDENGLPTQGAQVSARLGDDQSVRVETTSNASGVAVFQNLPDRTIILDATASGNRFATVATYGAASQTSMKLRAFDPPSAIYNNDFSQGTAGWNIGSAPVEIAAHVEGGGGLPPSPYAAGVRPDADEAQALLAPPRDGANAPRLSTLGALIGTSDATNMDLVLSTMDEGPQAVSRTFTVQPGTSSVKVRFRFITSEVPGGYFGTEYNDYFSVSIRNQAGGATSNSNTMNGLGLTAFDDAGATAWLEVSLPVNAAGDMIQVDALVANVADGLYDSQVVVDVVAEEKLSITVDKRIACPNETITFRPKGNPTGTITWSNGGNPATGSGNIFATRFDTNDDHTVQATLTDGSGTQTATKIVHINEKSGAAWVARFPTSKSTSDLVAGFAISVNRFISALAGAGVPAHINATLRPEERAYLMHYSYKVAHGLDPTSVPAKAGVAICWAHRDASGNVDLAASRAAAQAMVSGYTIVHAPALHSRHTKGRAIDMSISWSGNLTITNASGTQVTIISTPRTGAGNTDLHAVGATYGVRKLVGDAPHWSDDGH